MSILLSQKRIESPLLTVLMIFRKEGSPALLFFGGGGGGEEA